MNQFKVISLGLNFRSKPLVSSSTVILVLNQGQVVTKKGVAKNVNWWKVSVNIKGKELDGYVVRRFLAPAPERESAGGPERISAVHLGENNKAVSRDYNGMRAYPLGESGMPGREGSTSLEKAKSVTGIIDWLDVENSNRYRKNKGSTYCNIYACDYAYLCHTYLPRVWWNEKALIELAAGKKVIPGYGSTIREMNANSLYEWLVEFGVDFGWNRVFSMTELQTDANKGKVCLISACNIDRNRPGHICAVVPETGTVKAVRHNGKVTGVLQSEAGGRNRKYTTKNLWWKRKMFGGYFGFWVHL